VFEKSLLLRWFLSSNGDREISFTESGNATCKTVDPDADKHKLSTLADTSSFGDVRHGGSVRGGLQ